MYEPNNAHYSTVSPIVVKFFLKYLQDIRKKGIICWIFKLIPYTSQSDKNI